MKTEVALSNLLMGGLTAVSVMLSSQMPWYIGIPVITGAIGSGAGVVARHRKYKLTANDYLDGVSEFCSDGEAALSPAMGWFADKTQPVTTHLVNRIPPIARTFLEAALTERDESWLSQAMIISSKFVLGPKASGKTTWIRYEARRFKAENPNGIVRIIDLHHLEEDGDWLPGLDAEDYLAIDHIKGMGFVRDMVNEGFKRIGSSTTTHPEYKLIIDEFQGLRNRISEAERAELDSAIQFSQDELRKYHINVTLTSKSYKKGMTGLDSSVVNQMDFLALGNAIADPNNVVPYDVDAKALTSKRSAVSALPGCKYSCVYRPLEGDAEIKVIPNDLQARSDTYRFDCTDELAEHEKWILQNCDRILALKQEGKSKTAIAQSFEGFGKRDDTNPRWLALSRFLAEKGN